MEFINSISGNLIFHAFLAFHFVSSVTGDVPPNIVMVVVDDWGWANVGYHSENPDEVKTPNIDALAAEGIKLDRYYAPRMCGPGRNSMFSGRNPIHNSYINGPMGTIPNSPESDLLGNSFDGTPLGMTLFPKKLQDAGYYTAFYGKWDLGQATNLHFPYARGFDGALRFQSFTIEPWAYRANPPFTPNFGLCNNTFPNEFFNYNYLDMFKNDLPAFE